MDAQITKPFEWIEHEGKRYANQKQFAALLGIRTQNLKRWLDQRNVSVLNLITLPKLNQVLYPYDVVCTAVLTHEVKSDLGTALKKSLLSMLTQPKVLPLEPKALLLPPKAERDQLREAVARVNTHLDIPYNEIWHKLWNELYYRCKVNVKVRARNSGKRPIDIIADLDLCSASIAIIKDTYMEAFHEELQTACN